MNARAYWAWLRARLFSVEMWIAYTTGGFFGPVLYFAAGGR